MNHYLKTIQDLLKSAVTFDGLKTLIEESQYFFQILKIKLESEDPEIRKQAASEISELRTMLENGLQKGLYPK